MSSIKKNFFFFSVLSLSQLVFPLLTIPYINRILIPEDIGRISYIENLIKLLMMFSALGIPVYGIREIAKQSNDPEARNILFNELFSIHIIGTTLVTIILFCFAGVNNHLSIPLSYYFAGSIMLISSVLTLEWYFQGTEDFEFITKRNIAIRFGVTLLIFFFIKSKSDAFLYLIFLIAYTALIGVINFTHLYKKKKLAFSLSYFGLRKHFKPLLLIFISLSFINFYTSFDTLILGYFADAKSIAVYTLGVRLGKIPVVFITSLGAVMIPRISQYNKEGNKEGLNYLINSSLKFIIAFAVPISFFIMGTSSNLIMLFGGIQYIHSQQVLFYLSFLTLLISLSNLFGFQILIPLGKDLQFMICIALGFLINIFINLVLTPTFKEFGTTIACLISELTVSILSFMIASKHAKINLKNNFYLKVILLFSPLIFINKINFNINSELINFIIYSIIALVYFIFVNYFIIRYDLIKDTIDNYLIKLKK